MKTWEMTIQGTTKVSVQADTCDNAIEKAIDKATELSIGNDLIWDDFRVVLNTIEVTDETN